MEPKRLRSHLSEETLGDQGWERVRFTTVILDKVVSIKQRCVHKTHPGQDPVVRQLGNKKTMIKEISQQPVTCQLPDTLGNKKSHSI